MGSLISAKEASGEQSSVAIETVRFRDDERDESNIAPRAHQHKKDM
jgi:hypothetical protein